MYMCICISFALFVIVTFLCQFKMGGLSSSANMSTAIMLNSEQVQKHFPGDSDNHA